MFKKDRIGFQARAGNLWCGAKLWWRYPLMTSTYFKNPTLYLFVIKRHRQIRWTPSLTPNIILTIFVLVTALTS